MNNNLLDIMSEWEKNLNGQNDNTTNFLNAEVKVNSLRKENSDACDLVFNENAIYEVGYGGMSSHYEYKLHQYFCKRISTKLVEPLLPNNLDKIFEYIIPEFRPQVTTSSNEKVHMLKKYMKSNMEPSVINFGANSNVYTFLDGALPQNKHSGTLKSGEIIVHPGYFFAELIMYSEVIKELRKVKSLSEVERNEDSFYQTILNLCSVLGKHIFIPQVKYTKERTEEIMTIMASYGATFTEICTDSRKSCELNRSIKYSKIIDTWYAIYFYIAKNIDIPFDLLYGDSKYPNFYHLHRLFKELILKYQGDKKTSRYNHSIDSEYATCYQTKRNIPKATLEAMSSSLFNNYFGYVEFDMECSLEKITIIEKEFEALEKIYGIGKLDDYDIRFRKLGKHKASGLYFPFQKCLCVDIDSPSSLAHELFHLIDYKNGCLSKKYSFLSIIKEYSKLIENTVNSDEALLQKWNGKSKYNRDYYLEPTEIFARCGEIYLIRFKNVSNSLISWDNAMSFAYPEGDELNNLINNYFSNILN